MNTSISRRSRLAVVLLAPVFVLATPALAMADTGPGGDGSTFEDSQSSTSRDGASSDRVRSCVDEDGNVRYERTVKHADANGTTTRTTQSGDNAANCEPGAQADARDGFSPRTFGNGSHAGRQGRNGGGLGVGGDNGLINISIGNVSVLNNGLGGR